MPSFAKRLGLWCAVLLSCLIVSIVFAKDKLAYRYLKKNIEDQLPGGTFSAQHIEVRLGSIRLDGFEVLQKKGSQRLLVLKGGDVRVAFSPTALFYQSPFFALRHARVSIQELSFGNISLKDIAADIDGAPSQKHLSVTLSIRGLSYNDIKAQGLKSRLVADMRSVAIDELSVFLWQGSVLCQGFISWERKHLAADIAARVARIEMSDAVKAFKLEKRFDLTGAFNGGLRLMMTDGVMKDLKGQLRSAQGGQFLLTDKSLASGQLPKFQGSNILIENLENYHYDIGNVDVRNDGQDIRLNMVFEGETGRRDFQIFWHKAETQ